MCPEILPFHYEMEAFRSVIAVNGLRVADFTFAADLLGSFEMWRSRLSRGSCKCTVTLCKLRVVEATSDPLESAPMLWWCEIYSVLAANLIAIVVF